MNNNELAAYQIRKEMIMRFPKILYVKIEDKDTDDEFLLADKVPANLAENESTTPLAEYKLVKKVRAVNETRLLKD